MLEACPINLLARNLFFMKRGGFNCVDQNLILYIVHIFGREDLSVNNIYSREGVYTVHSK